MCTWGGDHDWSEVMGSSGLYDVSQCGLVRRREDGLIYSPGRTKNYRHVNLVIDGKRRKRYVHRLVLESFVGPCPDGQEALHGDGDPTNNNLSNLRWGTRAENMADCSAHGNTLRGRRHPSAKLSKDVVLGMRSGNIGIGDAVRICGVHPTTARQARRGVSWSWVGEKCQ